METIKWHATKNSLQATQEDRAATISGFTDQKLTVGLFVNRTQPMSFEKAESLHEAMCIAAAHLLEVQHEIEQAA